MNPTSLNPNHIISYLFHIITTQQVQPPTPYSFSHPFVFYLPKIPFNSYHYLELFIFIKMKYYYITWLEINRVYCFFLFFFLFLKEWLFGTFFFVFKESLHIKSLLWFHLFRDLKVEEVYEFINIIHSKFQTPIIHTESHFQMVFKIQLVFQLFLDMLF